MSMYSDEDTGSLELENEKRPLSEIMEDFSNANYGKECRELHKELKRYYNKRLPLFMRYPNFPLYVSVVVLVFEIMALIASIVLF